MDAVGAMESDLEKRDPLCVPPLRGGKMLKYYYLKTYDRYDERRDYTGKADVVWAMESDLLWKS